MCHRTSTSCDGAQSRRSCCASQARSQSQYVAELQDMVEELQAAQSLVQDQRHSHQAEVRISEPPALDAHLLEDLANAMHCHCSHTFIRRR